MMGPGHYWWGDTWWHGGMWMFPLILLIVVLLVVYLIFGRGGWRPPGYNERTETALDILKKRYASGEISKAEFDQIKKDLTS